MTNKNLFRAIQAFAVFGILLAVYLLWQQMARPTFTPCTINEAINCNAIIDGPVSKTLNIPTPLYGLVGYVVVFFAAMLRKKRLLFGTSVFGLLFCLWIGFRELFQLHVVCPVCILCQLTMISVFILSFKALRSSDVA